MLVVDLAIAVGEYEQPVGSGDPSAQIPDCVESHLICPLSVFDHENRGTQAPGQQFEKHRHHGQAITVLQSLSQRSLFAGDVPERRQRLRSQQIITKSDMDVGLIGVALDKFPDQGGLADAGLSTHEDDFPA